MTSTTPAKRQPRAATPQAKAKAAPSEPLSILFRIRPAAPPRRMAVRIPNAEQLAVWQGIGEQLNRVTSEWREQNAAMTDMPGDHPDAIAARVQQNRQATRVLARTLKLVKSVLVNDVDHDWVDDQILEGATLEEVLRIVTETVDEVRRVNPAAAAAVPADAVRATLSE